jgi:hypothetical protein
MLPRTSLIHLISNTQFINKFLPQTRLFRLLFLLNPMSLRKRTDSGYGYGYRHGYNPYATGPDPNGCPPGYTFQGGNCAPYKGPSGGGWNTWNGCPPGYTIQGGNCAPYRYSKDEARSLRR